MQSVAQFPFQNAILKIESKKKERACRALFLFYYSRITMGTRTAKAGPTEELSVVRRKISELVARHAVPMVQQAIDALRDADARPDGLNAQRFADGPIILVPALKLLAPHEKINDEGHR